MKIDKTKIEQAHIFGFIGGVLFANAVHAAIALPLIALHHSGGAKGKHNWHQHHQPTGPVHFLAEQNARQARDERVLLAEIKDELAEIRASLPKQPETSPTPHPEPEGGHEPEPPKEGPAPEPDAAPEPPKPEHKPEP